MDKTIKRTKIIDIKTKQPIFDEWIKDVQEQNDFKNIKSAFLLWSDDEKGYSAKLNIDIDELSYYAKCLNDELFNRKVEDFMKKNINDFIKYVE